MEHIKVFDKDRITHITINRAENENSLNAEVIKELTEAFIHTSQTSDSKVVTLKAKGEVFCTGMEVNYLQELQNASDNEKQKATKNLAELFKAIYMCPKPIVAQIQGHAVAEGCTLVSLCDFAFSVPDAFIGYNDVKTGYAPALSLPYLREKIGSGPAKELMLSGNLISAEEAMFFKLISHVADDEVLNAEVKDFAITLADTNSGAAMNQIKTLFRNTANLSLEDSIDTAIQSSIDSYNSEDFKNGLDSVSNKQMPNW